MYKCKKRSKPSSLAKLCEPVVGRAWCAFKRAQGGRVSRAEFYASDPLILKYFSNDAKV